MIRLTPHFVDIVNILYWIETTIESTVNPERLNIVMGSVLEIDLIILSLNAPFNEFWILSRRDIQLHQ